MDKTDFLYKYAIRMGWINKKTGKLTKKFWCLFKGNNYDVPFGLCHRGVQ